MTTSGDGPTVHRRVLARELRELRRAAGLTHIDIANRLGWQQGKMSKIESAKQSVPVEAVIALAEVCRAAPEHRDRLVTIAMEARSKGWWERYSEVVPPAWQTYIGLETDADQIDLFGIETIPEILQVDAYASAWAEVRVGDRHSSVSPGRATELLAERQRILLEERATELRVVLTEAALYRVVGGVQALRRQLEHLRDLAHRRHVTLRVLPFAAGALPIDTPFAVLSFHRTPHPDLVFVPNRVGGVYYERSDDVARYRAILSDLENMSRAPDESIRMLAERVEKVSQCYAMDG